MNIRLLFLILFIILIVGVVWFSFNKAPSIEPHGGIQDPNVYIPLREEMTRMEMRYLDLQILTSSDPIIDADVQKAIAGMLTSVKKIQEVNPNDQLDDDLENLESQLSSLHQQNASQDPKQFKANLDRLFQTCFRCHLENAPMM